MSHSVASPPLAPVGFDFDVYIVLDDFGSLGRSYRETAEEEADRESLIRDLMGGQYNNPARIVCFNTARKGEEISPGLRDFIEWEIERSKRLEAVR